MEVPLTRIIDIMVYWGLYSGRCFLETPILTDASTSELPATAGMIGKGSTWSIFFLPTIFDYKCGKPY